MTKIVPYLFFNGKAREAMTFYQSCLGGDLQIMTFGDAPGDPCPAGQRDQVMHGAIIIGGEMVLMASDSPDQPIKAGQNVHLSLNLKTAAEVDKVFGTLSPGGTVVQKPHDAFWGDRFAMVVDRYGHHWMLNAKK